jgi:hypothetical protein
MNAIAPCLIVAIRGERDRCPFEIDGARSRAAPLHSGHDAYGSTKAADARTLVIAM